MLIPQSHFLTLLQPPRFQRCSLFFSGILFLFLLCARFFRFLTRCPMGVRSLSVSAFRDPDVPPPPPFPQVRWTYSLFCSSSPRGLEVRCFRRSSPLTPTLTKRSWLAATSTFLHSGIPPWPSPLRTSSASFRAELPPIA